MDGWGRHIIERVCQVVTNVTTRRKRHKQDFFFVPLFPVFHCFSKPPIKSFGSGAIPSNCVREREREGKREGKREGQTEERDRRDDNLVLQRAVQCSAVTNEPWHRKSRSQGIGPEIARASASCGPARARRNPVRSGLARRKGGKEKRERERERGKLEESLREKRQRNRKRKRKRERKLTDKATWPGLRLLHLLQLYLYHAVANRPHALHRDARARQVRVEVRSVGSLDAES